MLNCCHISRRHNQSWITRRQHGYQYAPLIKRVNLSAMQIVNSANLNNNQQSRATKSKIIIDNKLNSTARLVTSIVLATHVCIDYRKHETFFVPVTVKQKAPIISFFFCSNWYHPSFFIIKVINLVFYSLQKLISAHFHQRYALIFGPSLIYQEKFHYVARNHLSEPY